MFYSTIYSTNIFECIDFELTRQEIINFKSYDMNYGNYVQFSLSRVQVSRHDLSSLVHKNLHFYSQHDSYLDIVSPVIISKRRYSHFSHT